MLPEAAKAVEIADKHLAGHPHEKRAALAKDIIGAICDHANRLVVEMLGTEKRQ